MPTPSTTTVFTQLAAAAQAHPDRPFLRWWDWRDERISLTYAESHQAACGTAAQLRAAGAGIGARIAVVLPNGPDLLRIWFAAAALGAVVIPLDPRLTDTELASVLDQSGPDLAVLPGREELAPAGTAVIDVPGDVRAERPPVRARDDGGAPAAILFTSGSTGRPKGCLISHDSLIVPAAEMVERLGLTSADTTLHVLPLHHMAGLSFLTTAITAGATIAMRPRFSGTRFWADAADSGATVFRHLGEMLAVLNQRQSGPGPDGHPLRLVYGGGATADVAGTFSKLFGVSVLEGYGLSETNTALAGVQDETVPGTLGAPLAHVEVRLVDPADGTVILGPGEGELQLRCRPAVMLGYFADPEATAQAFSGHWFRTGDQVRRDDEGVLHFQHRIKDIIRRRGENIDPVEIENTASALPGVRKAVAVGIPAEHGSTEIRIFVEADGSVTPDDIRGVCAQRLAPFKQPRFVDIVDRLPLTRTEKIDKASLRAAEAPV
jgi:acyl-CoA synthetase (AMP-forming)/AMP-acid ligase II